MSWASERETSRIEDRAYCLMGLFHVHMPMIYGEGNQAFIRLQEEIMRTTNDQTIFAWDGGWPFGWNRGLLAPSPEFFAGSGAFTRSFDGVLGDTRFTSTNRGINLQLPLQVVDTETGLKTYLAVLNCEDLGRRGHLIAVPLDKVSGDRDRFTRGYLLQSVDISILSDIPRKSVFVRQERHQQSVGTKYKEIFIDESNLEGHGLTFWESYPKGWLQPDNTLGSTLPLFDDLIGGIGYRISDVSRFFIVLKLVKNHLSVNIEVLEQEESAEEIFHSYNQQRRREWKNEPDRLIRTLPTGKLFVAIRKQVAKGQRAFVIHLSFTNQ